MSCAATVSESTLWGGEGETGLPQRLQKRITALRHKLESEPCFPRYIVTEPAVGYRREMIPPAVEARE